MRKTPHAYEPWPGNVICKCGLRKDSAIHIESERTGR